MSTFASMRATVRELCEVIAALNPPIKPRLYAPASAEDIYAAEQALGLAFPDDLRHLLLCHDGQDFFHAENGYGDPLVPMMRQPANGQAYSHYWLNGVKEIVDYTRNCREDREYYQDEHFEKFGPARFHDQYIAFTATENADCLVLDMSPASGGHVGQVVLYCTQAPQIMVLAPDLETYLQTLTADYRRGRFLHKPCEYFVSYVEAG